LVTRIVPLDYELKGGEIVDIIVDSKVHPTREWLSFARTTTARTKIRRYLKTYEREINLQLGRERLDLALKAAGASGVRAVHDEDLSQIDTNKKYNTSDDMYVALGREDLAVTTVLEQLTPLLQNRGDMKQEIVSEHDELRAHRHQVPAKNGHTPHEDGASELAQVLSDKHADSQGKPANSGTDSHFEVVVKLAHCCCPIPGDAIVGFLNPNKGIIVHRTDCRTLRRRREYTRERFVEVNWLQIEPQPYLAPIIIIAHDRAGLLRDVAAVVADAGINMTAVASTTNASLQKAVITATLEIEAIDQIEPIFKRLLQIKNVVSVARDLGRRIG